MLRVFAVTQAEDIGALVDENLFERDILLSLSYFQSKSKTIFYMNLVKQHASCFCSHSGGRYRSISG